METNKQEPSFSFSDPLVQYSRDVKSLPVPTKEDEEEWFRRIDKAELLYVQHILSHPNVEILLKSILKSEFAKEDNEMPRILGSALKVVASKNFKAAKVAASFVPYSRFSDATREWMDKLPTSIMTMKGVKVTTAWMKKLVSLGDDRLSSKNQFVSANLRLVMQIAHRYARTAKSLSVLDLIQDGNIGLMRAVEKFNAGRGFRFSTYAVWWIRHHIKRTLQDCDKDIRIPVHISDKMSQVAKVVNSQYNLTGEIPSNDHIAKELKLPKEKIESLQYARKIAIVPVDAPFGASEDSPPIVDWLEDPSIPSPIDSIAQSRLADAVKSILNRLPYREAQVLKMRFGLGVEEHTLQEVASKWDLSRERIRQIEADALRHMRSHRALKDYLDKDERPRSRRLAVSCRS